MPEKIAILIDGNNLYHNLKGSKLEPSDINILKLCDFICSHFGFERGDIFYYISIPKMDDPVYFKHIKFLKSLNESGIKVITRKLQYKSTTEAKIGILEIIDKMNLCEKCKPVVIGNLLTWIGSVIKKEKGIDVMLGVDTIRFTIEKQYESCIILSGDVDLLSAMKFAESKGGKIFSACTSCGYSSELQQNFKDRHFKIERKDILENCIKDEI